MDTLVKNKLMTKPMVLPHQPVEVVLKSPKEGMDIKTEKYVDDIIDYYNEILDY